MSKPPLAAAAEGMSASSRRQANLAAFDQLIENMSLGQLSAVKGILDAVQARRAGEAK